jgi:hypothetical protein
MSDIILIAAVMFSTEHNKGLQDLAPPTSHDFTFSAGKQLGTLHRQQHGALCVPILHHVTWTFCTKK